MECRLKAEGYWAAFETWTTGKEERKPVAQGGGYSNYNRSVFFKTITAARYETTIRATQESSKNVFIMVFFSIKVG